MACLLFAAAQVHNHLVRTVASCALLIGVAFLFLTATRSGPPGPARVGWTGYVPLPAEGSSQVVCTRLSRRVGVLTSRLGGTGPVAVVCGVDVVPAP